MKIYQIGQSNAIARYFAKKAGIAGKNDVDQALADGLVDFVADLFNGENGDEFIELVEDKYVNYQLVKNNLIPSTSCKYVP
jgi:hypothetical protein